MQFIPIKTRRLDPPQDDLLAVFDECLTDLKENDVVIVTSKVVSIHLGLCIKDSEMDREAMTKQQAEGYLVDESGKTRPLTIKHHAFLYRAGIDSGNSGEYHTVLPENPYEVAAELRG